MAQYKFYEAKYRRFGIPAIIITVVDRTTFGQIYAESYLLIPDENNTIHANKIYYEQSSFYDSPFILDEDFMLDEALAQAKIDLLGYLTIQEEQDKSGLCTEPIISDSTIKVLATTAIRRLFPHLEYVYKKSTCVEFRDYLKPALDLPTAINKSI
jgi:hypothetical protein